MEKIAIIIVNYKSREYLDECISSIFDNFKDVNFEILIVNNDKEKLGGVKREKVSVIEINKNIGFGKSSNIGAREASGDVFLFLNPDTTILSKNIKKVIKRFNKNESVGIIGPKIVEKNGSVQKWSAGDDPSVINIIKNNLGFTSKVLKKNKPQAVDWVTGAALFVKSDLFIELKGFDERFFLYFEDVDLCKRARETGKDVVYFPEFKVRHLGGKSSNNKKEQKEEYYKSQDYYFEKWFGERTKNLVRFLRLFHF